MEIGSNIEKTDRGTRGWDYSLIRDVALAWDVLME